MAKTPYRNFCGSFSSWQPQRPSSRHTHAIVLQIMDRATSNISALGCVSAEHGSHFDVEAKECAVLQKTHRPCRGIESSLVHGMRQEVCLSLLSSL